MRTFNNYSSKMQTSSSLMRQVKRDIVLAVGLSFGAFSLSEDKKKGCLMLKEKGNPDLHKWLVEKVNGTNFLEGYRTGTIKGENYALWEDTRKARIYSKWLTKDGTLTYTRVLKYLHMPIFITLFVLSKGRRVANGLFIDLEARDRKSAEMFVEWLDFHYMVDSEALDRGGKGWSIFLDQENAQNLIQVVETDIINLKVPILSEKFDDFIYNKEGVS